MSQKWIKRQNNFTMKSILKKSWQVHNIRRRAWALGCVSRGELSIRSWSWYMIEYETTAFRLLCSWSWSVGESVIEQAWNFIPSSSRNFCEFLAAIGMLMLFLLLRWVVSMRLPSIAFLLSPKWQSTSVLEHQEERLLRLS